MGLFPFEVSASIASLTSSTIMDLTIRNGDGELVLETRYDFEPKPTACQMLDLALQNAKGAAREALNISAYEAAFTYTIGPRTNISFNRGSGFSFILQPQDLGT